MLTKIFNSLLNKKNNKFLKKAYSIVKIINLLENKIKPLSDHELQEQTQKFRKIISQCKSKQERSKILDHILPEAFATVREASLRVFQMRHFDVQLLGGIALHHGMIAEMKTGEGKTLVATLAAYLNALTGNGVHIVTTNDYLAKRDSQWMGKLYQFLGLTVGCIEPNSSSLQKQEAYKADITYGTNNEFGFDYLRDNLKYSKDELVQKTHSFAIIDEVDSILIDEARTPLIISGPTESNLEICYKVNTVVEKLILKQNNIKNIKENIKGDNETKDTEIEKDNRNNRINLNQNNAANTLQEVQEGFYLIDEKTQSALLTEKGNNAIEEILKQHHIINQDSGIYDYENMNVLHCIQQALKAHTLFKKDVHYIIKNDNIIIIDEFTGRAMTGRRYSEGLHQAIEAKENVSIKKENQTIASITFQNYFRLYPKLAGMTGTAKSEAKEFQHVYNLSIAEIPTHLPIKRKDEDDIIYKSIKQKYRMIVQEIKLAHKKMQPVLVGTASIERSEELSKMLKKEKIKHNILNAKYPQKEAEIIAQAGAPSAVTIATNMAGRGTDIKLGGNFESKLIALFQEQNKKINKNLKKKKNSHNKNNNNASNEINTQITTEDRENLLKQIEQNKQIVLSAGGLLVIGTERHESRRIDDQLRGRSGRQGDPGRTLFFLSMEDDLMRMFGSEKLAAFLTKMGLKEEDAIVHPWITKSLQRAQQKVEMNNYDIRKNILSFDNVLNEQRKVIYAKRRLIMELLDQSLKTQQPHYHQQQGQQHTMQAGTGIIQAQQNETQQNVNRKQNIKLNSSNSSNNEIKNERNGENLSYVKNDNTANNNAKISVDISSSHDVVDIVDEFAEINAENNQNNKIEELYLLLIQASSNYIKRLIQLYIPEKSYKEEWNTTKLTLEIKNKIGLEKNAIDEAIEKSSNGKEVYNILVEHIKSLIKKRLPSSTFTLEKNLSKNNIHSNLNANTTTPHDNSINNDNNNNINNDNNDNNIFAILKHVFLNTIDHLWKDHLYNLDKLRKGISLRAYGQKNPLTEYQIESFHMFKALLQSCEEQMIEKFSMVSIAMNNMNNHSAAAAIKAETKVQEKREGAIIKVELEEKMEAKEKNEEDKQQSNSINNALKSANSPNSAQFTKKKSRNALCECGSGKKYKHCHGSIKHKNKL